MFIRGRYGQAVARATIGNGAQTRSSRAAAKSSTRACTSSTWPAPSSGISRGQGHDAHVLLGHGGRRRRLPARTAQGRPPGCTPPGPNGRTCFRWRSTAETASCDRRVGRQLRPRGADLLPDAAEMGPPATTPGNSRGPTTPGPWRPQVLRRHPPRANPVARTAEGIRTLEIVEAIYKSSGYPSHDHHTLPLARIPWRRRHRPAVLLSRARRVPHGRCDRQVRLHHQAPDLPGGDHRQVFQAGACELGGRDEHPIVREALKLVGVTDPHWRSPPWPTSRPERGSDPRGASRRPFSRRCTPTRRT